MVPKHVVVMEKKISQPQSSKSDNTVVMKAKYSFYIKDGKDETSILIQFTIRNKQYLFAVDDISKAFGYDIDYMKFEQFRESTNSFKIKNDWFTNTKIIIKILSSRKDGCSKSVEDVIAWIQQTTENKWEGVPQIGELDYPLVTGDGKNVQISIRFMEMNGEYWLAGVDLADAIGYKNPSAQISHTNNGCIDFRDLFKQPNNAVKIQNVWYFNNKTAIEFLSYTKRYVTNMKKLAKWIEKESHNGWHFISSKSVQGSQESITIEKILTALGGNFKYEPWAYVRPSEKYKRRQMDLYFKDQNLVVECDEYGHKNYDPADEAKRNEWLNKSMPGIRIYRYNPKGNIFNIIGDILTKLLYKIEE